MEQERSLNPIFEDPDEHKKSRDEDDHERSFSEDSIELPGFSAAAPPNPARITFANSSFSSFIRRTSSPDITPASVESGMTSAKSPVVTGNLLDFDDWPKQELRPNPALSLPSEPVVPKKMVRVNAANSQHADRVAEMDDLSDSSDEFGPAQRTTPGISVMGYEAPAGSLDHGTSLGNNSEEASRPGSERRFSLESWTERQKESRKLVLPDPVPAERPGWTTFTQREVSDFEVEIVRLKAELNTARTEIEDLVSAVHQKDQSVLAAQETIKRLTSGITRRESIERQERLDRALARTVDLEGRNLRLQSENQKKANHSEGLAKTLHEVASLLRIQEIPADDSDLAVHIRAKVDHLLRVEQDLSTFRNAKLDSAQTVEVLQQESDTLRRALSFKDERFGQSEKRVRELEDEVKRLDVALAETVKKAQYEEELSHAVAAEARTLSDELRSAHDLLDRKDELLADLEAKLGGGSLMVGEGDRGDLPKNAARLNGETRPSANVDHSSSLKAENESLKNTICGLENRVHQMDRRQQNIPMTNGEGDASNGLSGRRPDLVASRRFNEPGKGNARREVRLLDAALTQVVSSANSVIAQLKTENVALVRRVEELEKSELSLRHEIEGKRQQLETMTVDLAASRATLHMYNQKNPESAEARRGSSDWGALKNELLLEQLKGFIKELIETKQRPVSSLHQAEIASLSGIIQQLERNLSTHIENSASLSQEVKTELVSHIQQFMTKNRPDDARIIENYRHDLEFLQKSLTERDEEIRHLRSASSFQLTGARPSSANPVGLPSQQSDSVLVVPVPRDDHIHIYSNDRACQAKPQQSKTVQQTPAGDTMPKLIQFLHEESRRYQNAAGDSAAPEVESHRHPTHRDLGEEKERLIQTLSVQNAVLLAEASNRRSKPPSPDLCNRGVQSEKESVNQIDLEGDFFAVSSPSSNRPTRSARVQSMPRRASEENAERAQRNHVSIMRFVTYEKLEPPCVDHDAVLRRSRQQLMQFEDLCHRIDQANMRYSTFVLPIPNTNLDL